MNLPIELLEVASRRFLGEQAGTLDPRLDHWLDEHADHRLAYAQVCAAWYAMAAEPEATESPRVSRRAGRASWLSACALMLLAALLWWPRSQSTAEQVLSPGISARYSANASVSAQSDPTTLALTLTRGRIWLSADTGEHQSISVQLGSWRIVDIGTRFVVDADRRRVAVYAGAVDISAADHPALRLVAGQAFDLGVQQRVDLDGLEQGLDRDQWIFVGLSLAQALAEVEREGTRIWQVGTTGNMPVPSMVLPDRNPTTALHQLCSQLKLSCSDLGPLGFIIVR